MYIHIHKYTCRYTCKYTHPYTCTMQMQMHIRGTYRYTYIHIYIYTYYIYTDIHIYIQIYIYIYIHIHIYIHTYIEIHIDYTRIPEFSVLQFAHHFNHVMMPAGWSRGKRAIHPTVIPGPGAIETNFCSPLVIKPNMAAINNPMYLYI